ncbi:GNAT family N-acetyltransferase [Aeromonas bestiarum]|uniref:GNAT family N-acetyltransferase n=1 Tax=Aeromonas bestiarum TaxID=105751 RepID=UPI0012ECDE27|nr:GNAT family N-acetyltransferase [Aeromonas bestiarum]MDM5089265.1 GNAT family N-acetyltransferase [Aeromonas bestiarum]
MNELHIEYTEDLSEAADAKMTEGHENYERENGIEINFKNFSFTLSDEKGEVFGVLSAYTAYSEIYVEDLWVDESLRQKGYGRKLLQTLEHYFDGKGYNNINLVTNEFQAPLFYKKCGYDIEFVRVNKSNSKLTKTFFIKYL